MSKESEVDPISRPETLPYSKFLKKNPKTIGFGFLNSFFSGLGQTHFISLFNPVIMADFSLSHSEYGSLYSLVTLVSGSMIVFVGPLIDRYDVRYFCLLSTVGLVTGLFSLYLAKDLLLLGLGLWGLRFFGQGLNSSIGSISVARYFTKDRGKALSLSQMGFPFYEILITPLFALLLNFSDFQSLLVILMIVVLGLYFPLGFWLTRKIPEFNKPDFHKHDKKKVSPPLQPKTIKTIGIKARIKKQSLKKNWSRREVFTEKTIYFLLGQVFMPPFILTGVFFHQTAIAQLKGWSLGLMAVGFIFFGLGRVTKTFIIGPLIDKYSARTLFPFYQAPLCIGLLILAQNHGSWVPPVCFLLFGLTVGSGGPIQSALWAELYGTKHLGALKSLFITLMIFSTSIAPTLFGYFIEKRYETAPVLYGTLISCLLFSLLSFIGLRFKQSS